MAYNYIEKMHAHTVAPTTGFFYHGANETSGNIKDFILSNFPEATLVSDNNPPLNVNGQSTVNRIITINIRNFLKIRISGSASNQTNLYGYSTLSMLSNTGGTIASYTVGTGEANYVLKGLFVDDVCYVLVSNTGLNQVYGYFLSDENICFILSSTIINHLTDAYSCEIMPAVGYTQLLAENKMVLTEFMLKKNISDPISPVLRFKNKKIFKPGIPSYFSSDRFYIGDDNHKYAFIANTFLIQLE